jgi:hypothetical protein
MAWGGENNIQTTSALVTHIIKTDLGLFDMFYSMHIKRVALDVLYSLTNFSNYTRCVAQILPISINFRLQMHIK